MYGKKILAIFIGLIFFSFGALAITFIILSHNLPQMISIEDYDPLLVTEVYDRTGQKMGQFYREVRKLVNYEDIPPVVVQAFTASEDASFFEHGGINYMGIVRAFMANLKAGRKVQGGSTITMQVARSILLRSREKTYTRKIKEVLLSYKMEENLTKEEILYLYLNQIYLGHSAHGIGMASEIYFRKPVSELTLPEAALLAGLPQAPSRYSPIYNPSAAKARQRYVLNRMAEEGHISEEASIKSSNEPLKVYVRKRYKELAPYYLETIRQLLVKKIGEVQVLDKGLKVYTGLDLQKQLEAQQQVKDGLRELDKRQGYRGALKNLSALPAEGEQKPTEEAKKAALTKQAEFLLQTRNQLMDKSSDVRIIRADGTIPEKGPLNLSGKDPEGQPLPNIPFYVQVGDIVKGLVTKVDDKWGLVYVRFAESKGVIDIETMKWARAPNPKVRFDFDEIKKPSQALKKGDLIEVRILSEKFSSSRLRTDLKDFREKYKKSFERYKKGLIRPSPKGKIGLYEKFQDYESIAGEGLKSFAHLHLEQEPLVEGSLISFDQKTQEVIAMVGGYNFTKSEFNRTIQAARQTGSAFKAMVYAAALDKGYTPNTLIVDAPIVYEEESQEIEEASGSDPDEKTIKRWKPSNHSKKFFGDILFRNALIDSLNVPTVKIIEKVGVNWVATYARRLGIFSPLNMDYTLALGSSGVTLYEMTKVFSQLGRLGQRIRPVIVHKVVDRKGKDIHGQIYLDERFEEELMTLDEEFEKRRQTYLTSSTAAPNPTQEGSEEAKDGDKPSPDGTTGEGEAQGKEALPLETPQFKAGQEPPLFFEDPDQLLRPQTAYLATSLLKGVVEEGTARRARALGRPSAGKTGTTNNYYDAWYLGYTPDIATGVWVGFDNEQTLGRGEVGGRAALPIWLNYMKAAHEGLPTRDFPTPENIVYANIDNETGQLASADSKTVVRQAFLEGTAPQSRTEDSENQKEKDFYKEELSE